MNTVKECRDKMIKAAELYHNAIQIINHAGEDLAIAHNILCDMSEQICIVYQVIFDVAEESEKEEFGKHLKTLESQLSYDEVIQRITESLKKE